MGQSSSWLVNQSVIQSASWPISLLFSLPVGWSISMLFSQPKGWSISQWYLRSANQISCQLINGRLLFAVVCLLFASSFSFVSRLSDGWYFGIWQHANSQSFVSHTTAGWWWSNNGITVGCWLTMAMKQPLISQQGIWVLLILHITQSICRSVCQSVSWSASRDKFYLPQISSILGF